MPVLPHLVKPDWCLSTGSYTKQVQAIAQISFVKLAKVLKSDLMNAVKSAPLKSDQLTSFPLGSPTLSHIKPNANVGNCIHIVLCVVAIH